MYINKSQLKPLYNNLHKYTKIPNLTLVLLYNIYKLFISQKTINDIYSNGRIKIIPELFKTENNYNIFIQLFSGNGDLFDYNEKLNQLYFNVEITNLIKDYFSGIFSTNKDTYRVDDEEDEEIEIIRIPLTDEKKNIYTPKHHIEFFDLHNLINKTFEFKFDLNPKIKKTHNFDTNSVGNVQKIDLMIRQKVITGDAIGEILVTKYKAICPTCNAEILYNATELGTTLKHDCGEKNVQLSNGKRAITTITGKSHIKPEIMINIYLYKCNIISKSNNVVISNTEDIYIYSFKRDLKPGKYTVDLVGFNNNLNVSKENKKLFFILGYEQQRPKASSTLITNIESKKYCNNNNIPYCKFMDVLFAIRKIHKQYTRNDITDQGMLFQMFLTLSGLAKYYFRYNKLGISIIGNKSLGKTYIAELFAMLLDRDHQYIQSGLDVSLAGLKGGINTAKMINGQTTRMFELGKFTTAGLLVMDEGDNFYNGKLLNSTLKNLLDRKITIAKVGGNDGIEQNYTPIILSNFYAWHKNVYIPKVKETYFLLLQKHIEDWIHPKDKANCFNYVSATNLFLPLSYYKKELNNEILLNAINFVRKEYEMLNIDWKTGGSIEANYRLLFDVVVWNEENKIFNKKNIIVGKTKSILPSIDQVPIDEFETELNEFCKSDINLLDEGLNSYKINNQLDKLTDSINKYLSNGGYILHQYLSNNSRSIDPKLNSILYNLILTIQLIEDIHSTKLSLNVKKFLPYLILKCKRGVSQKEYDFKEHILNFKYQDIDHEELKTKLDEIKHDEDAERTAKQMIKLQKEDNERASNKELNINDDDLDSLDVGDINNDFVDIK